MTTTNGFDTTERPGRTGRPDGGIRWICPYCGASRVNPSSGEAGEKNAVAALRSHILASDGGGHGPRNELPDDDERTLFEYVRRVDGQE